MSSSSSYLQQRRTATTGAPPSTVEPGSTVRGGPADVSRQRDAHALYGRGPVRRNNPTVLWTYPDKGMCSQSHDLAGFAEWCGTGWTGEPAVWERGRQDDGGVSVRNDRALHVLDASNGKDLFEPFVTGDLIKGSVSVDPEGFPLIYSGSRDDYFRVYSFDGPKLTEEWKLWAYDVSPTKWKQRLGRVGLVPRELPLRRWRERPVPHREAQPHHRQRTGRCRSRRSSSSCAGVGRPGDPRHRRPRRVDREFGLDVRQRVVYFANSGGLIEGWDVSGLSAGTTPKQVFRFWTGR